jgi:hypothetical protein
MTCDELHSSTPIDYWVPSADEEFQLDEMMLETLLDLLVDSKIHPSEGEISNADEIAYKDPVGSCSSIDCSPPTHPEKATYIIDHEEDVLIEPQSIQSKKDMMKQEKASCIDEMIRDNDVLLGRGSGSNKHIGNKNYLDRVFESQQEYKILDVTGKKALINVIISWVELQGGRFLSIETTPEGHRRYSVASDKKVKDKVSRALRGDPRCPPRTVVTKHNTTIDP